MKFLLCFLFAFYPSLDVLYLKKKVSISPSLICLFAAGSFFFGYRIAPHLLMKEYTNEELTMIPLMIVLLYHLSLRTRKFDFLHFFHNPYLSFLNETGFGILCFFQNLPISLVIINSVLFHLFFLNFCPSFEQLQRKRYSILLLVLMIVCLQK